MKKLLFFWAACVLIGSMSAKAQSASDSAYARDLSYSTINCSSLPDTLYDTLTPASKLLKDIREGSPAKGYTFTLSSAMTMNIKMLSGGWDCYLYLLDSSYNVLAYNDDWGGSRNGSRIIRQLSSGTYHLLACNYSEGRLSSSCPYRIVLDTSSFGDLSSLTFEPRTFGQPFTDTLSNGGQTVQTIGGGIAYAKGYSMNFPASNVMLQIDTRERMILILDSSYNYTMTNGYGNTRKVIIPVSRPTTCRFVIVSNDDYELDTTLGRPFTINSDTINAATFATLSYRNINIGDTIIDSINSTDPYLISGMPISYLLKKVQAAKGTKRPDGLTHARGYVFRTSATDKYLQFTTQNIIFSGASYFFVLDSNKHTIKSFYCSNDNQKYLSVNPSSTYYIVATSDNAEDTGVFKFFTKTDTDIPVFYVDALNGSDDSSGMTPATAKRTLNAVGYTTADARVYLTEDYHFTTNARFDRYVEIYPYGKSIRLYPEITSWSSAIHVNGDMVFGKNGDSLYFVIDSAVCHSVEELLYANNGVIEVNNFKVRNTFYESSLFGADSVCMNNCEFVDDTTYEIADCPRLRMFNTTVSNNYIDGVLFGGRSLYFENSTVTGNTATRLSAFELGSATLKSGTITNNRMVNVNDYGEILAPLNVRSENLAGIFFLYSGGLTIGPNFTMDTSAYLFVDRNSVINTPEAISVPTAAKVYPINYDFSSINPDYFEGRQLLAGTPSAVAANRSRFAIVQPADQTWYIHSNGRMYTTQEGIVQARREVNVKIYPNPAADHAFVQIDDLQADEIVVMDMFGKTVKRVAASVSLQTMGLQELESGLYFVQLRNAGKVVATRKLIKK